MCISAIATPTSGEGITIDINFPMINYLLVNLSYCINNSIFMTKIKEINYEYLIK